MKFVEVAKARGLKFNEPVYCRCGQNPNPCLGRLIKEEKTAEGTVKTFELAAWAEDFDKPGRIVDDSVVPYTTTAVTHVCIPRPS